MAPLTGVYSCSLAWGDYDNDGDLDLAVSGQVASGSYAGKIYRNDNGTFVDIGASLAAVYLCSLAWGDYDNDGNLDLAVSGLTASGSYVSRIYRNVNGVFSDLGLQLVGLSGSSLAWGDYDNDGNLDLALTGAYNDGTNHYVSKIYHNVNGISMRNTSPAAPTGLWAGFGASGITLSWNAATDAQAPAAGLSYNVRIGSTRGGCDLFSGMASSSTGLRKLPATGNAQKKLSWTVKAAPWLSRCYASVQAIDTSFAGSPWAVECSYTDIIRAKSLADETSVSSSGIVTAVFGDVFYIEKDDCTSGIRVSKTSHGAKIGDRVTASGVIRTLDGERYIAASSVTPSGTAVVPAPFGMNANSVGGGTLGLQLGVSDWRLVQDSVTKAWNRQNVVYGGPNNIGLLVRIAGKVSHLGNGIFYLDGACPFDDGDPSAKGICVAWPFADAMPADGALVQMTAVSSCTIRYGHIVRLLRPISASSVVPVP